MKPSVYNNKLIKLNKKKKRDTHRERERDREGEKYSTCRKRNNARLYDAR